MFNTRILSLILLCSVFSNAFSQQKPKYIFYMIGDGMGLNHVNITEMYLAELAGRIGVEPLVFSQFPSATFATTFSKSNGVTDSAAGGTALAVGEKTKNGVIGMDSTQTRNLMSIAYDAKAKGLKVGITTSVSIDHATPASFYAHQPDRGFYYEIATDIVKSKFDFFAGSGFLKPTTNHKKESVKPIDHILKENGYQLVQGIQEFNALKNTDKVILMNNKGASAEALNYAIDQQAGDLTLPQITQAAVKALTQDNPNGFFLMVEGGKIDWSSHANDAATTIQEVLDFNESVKIAYDFYLQHPEETLIVITADHETGGYINGNGTERLNLKGLSSQKLSKSALSSQIAALRQSKNEVSWSEVKALLQDNLGLWSQYKISEQVENQLKEVYQKSFINKMLKVYMPMMIRSLI